MDIQIADQSGKPIQLPPGEKRVCSCFFLIIFLLFINFRIYFVLCNVNLINSISLKTAVEQLPVMTLFFQAHLQCHKRILDLCPFEHKIYYKLDLSLSITVV